jgi:hypothetical protein
MALLGSVIACAKRVGSLGLLQKKLPGLARPFCANPSAVATQAAQAPIQITRSLPRLPRLMTAPIKRFSAKLPSWFSKDVLVPVPFALFCAHSTLQCYFGTKDDFFYGSFITNKNPDAIAEFYQAEDLLKIIAMHPIFFKLFMDKVQVGESPANEDEALLTANESVMVVKGLGMTAAFEIMEEEDEVDGEARRTIFKRYERFVDYIPLLSDFGYRYLLWDQTWTFGFRRLENGKYEVYHKGHKFVGPWPVRIIVYFHQKYVIRACERYVNSLSFANEEDEAMDRREQMLECMPLTLIKKKSRMFSSGSGMRIQLNM